MKTPEAPAQSRNPSNEKHGRFLFIDALRGIAALSVLLFHFYEHLSIWGQARRFPLPIHLVLVHGDQGVFIFFVLSGFVIAYTVGRVRITAGYLGRFALRRSLRLDPPYWAIILLTLAFLYTHQHLTTAGEIRPGLWHWTTLPANLFYLNKLLRQPTIVPVGWTLCLELQFYLVYVIATGLTQRMSSFFGDRPCVARSFVFGPLAIYSLAIASGIASDPWPGLFISYWYLFFLGVGVAWFMLQQSGPSLAWAVICITALTALRGSSLQTSVGAATAALILLVGQFGKLRDAGNWKWAQYLGRISYSLYLVHPLIGHRILDAVLRHTSPGRVPSIPISWASFVFATAASFLGAHLMYIGLERPAHALSRKIRLQPADARNPNDRH